MPFLLRFDGVDDYVDIPEQILVGDGVIAQFDFVFIDLPFDVYASGPNFEFRHNFSGVAFRVEVEGVTQNLTLVTPLVEGERYYLKLERFNGSVFRLLDRDDNVISNTRNIGSANLRISRLGDSFATGSAAAIELYTAIIGNASSPLAIYNKQAISGPNDTVFPDTVGGNDGTLVNFPTDNSQWVFFSDGGASADVNFTVNAPIFSSNASATLPNPSAAVDFTIDAPTFSATGDVTFPQPSATADITIDAPTFSATASATEPNFTAVVNITIPEPEFNATAIATQPQPSANVDITIDAPLFNASATATLPNPAGVIDFTIDAPTFSATAEVTEPDFNAVVDITIDAPLFSASASATVPQPVAAVNFTIPAPLFAGVAIPGGIDIIITDETNINLPNLSTNIDLPELSTNIEV